MAKVELSLKQVIAKSRKTSLITGGIFFGIFTLLIGFFKITGEINSEKDIQISIVNISNFEELKKAQSSYLNDKFVLTDDIVIDEEFSIGDDSNFFTGELNGNGHTIKIDYPVTKSFIYRIEKEAIISNVKFLYSISSGNLMEDFGGISTYNYGTISNCIVEYSNNLLIQDAKNVGGVTAFNFGKIENSLVQVNFNELVPSSIASNAIGGVAARAFKGSKVANTVSIVKSDYLTRNAEKAANIGAYFGYQPQSEVVNENCYSVFDTQKFCDKYYGIVNFVDKTKLYEADFYLEEVKLNSLIWNISNGVLPSLKINSVE